MLKQKSNVYMKDIVSSVKKAVGAPAADVQINVVRNEGVGRRVMKTTQSRREEESVERKRRGRWVKKEETHYLTAQRP